MTSEQQLGAIRAAPGIIRVHGHRGARGILPENSLEGFAFTFSADVRVVELDLLVTADHIPVITHNPQLMSASTRGADGKWLCEDGPLISECTFAELQTFDIGGLRPGSEYGQRYPDQVFLSGIRIPGFDSLCQLIRDDDLDDVWLNIEIKSDPRFPANTPEIPEYVADILKPIFASKLEDRVILQSFDWRVLHECERQAPQISRSYLSYIPKPNAPLAVNIYEGSPWMDGLSLEEHRNSLPRVVAHAGGQVWSPFFEDLTAEDMQMARNEGLVVNVWTVNERADIEHMIDLGVDGIITDYPGRVQRCLLEHGLSWK